MRAAQNTNGPLKDVAADTVTHQIILRKQAESVPELYSC